MKKIKTYLRYKGLSGFIEYKGQDITMDEIKRRIAIQEDRDYKQLRREYPESQYDIVKIGTNWMVNPKE